jgi:hypothetical protein
MTDGSQKDNSVRPTKPSVYDDGYSELEMLAGFNPDKERDMCSSYSEDWSSVLTQISKNLESKNNSD